MECRTSFFAILMIQSINNGALQKKKLGKSPKPPLFFDGKITFLGGNRCFSDSNRFFILVTRGKGFNIPQGNKHRFSVYYVRVGDAGWTGGWTVFVVLSHWLPKLYSFHERIFEGLSRFRGFACIDFHHFFKHAFRWFDGWSHRLYDGDSLFEVFTVGECVCVKCSLPVIDIENSLHIERFSARLFGQSSRKGNRKKNLPVPSCPAFSGCASIFVEISIHF